MQSQITRRPVLPRNWRTELEGGAGGKGAHPLPGMAGPSAGQAGQNRVPAAVQTADLTV
jgi:hypothetical protein